MKIPNTLTKIKIITPNKSKPDTREPPMSNPKKKTQMLNLKNLPLHPPNPIINNPIIKKISKNSPSKKNPSRNNPINPNITKKRLTKINIKIRNKSKMTIETKSPMSKTNRSPNIKMNWTSFSTPEKNKIKKNIKYPIKKKPNKILNLKLIIKSNRIPTRIISNLLKILNSIINKISIKSIKFNFPNLTLRLSSPSKILFIQTLMTSSSTLTLF